MENANGIRSGFKLFTSDFRPPVQGGEPQFDGALPYAMPATKLDTSSAECGQGYNYCGTLDGAFKIAGLWPNGRPSVAVLVEAGPDAIERGSKRRAGSMELIRWATDEEVAAAILALSAPFGDKAKAIAREQILWREALGRPRRSRKLVVSGLKAALAARGLDWQVREYNSAWDARAARAARAAWDARAAWAAWAAWDARAAWAAWDARAAWAALTVWYAGSTGWVSHKPNLLTLGLRAACRNGLEIALPTGPNELGFAMAEGGGND